MHRESISAKNFIGLKPQMFSPVNVATSMVILCATFLQSILQACKVLITRFATASLVRILIQDCYIHLIWLNRMFTILSQYKIFIRVTNQ